MRWLALLLTASVLAAPATAGVIVVDPSGDAGEAIQTAVDAAADGDTLVLLPGDYSPQDHIYVSIVGKGLTIVPAAGAEPVFHYVSIADLPVGSQVVLRGIELVNFVTGAGALTANGCAGAIWIEDCTVSAFTQLPGSGFFDPPPGVAGALLIDCAAVNFVRCQLTGGGGAPENVLDLVHPHPASRGGHGAEVRNSSATFHDCVLAGGVGGDGKTAVTGKEGGAGLFVQDSQVLLAGGSATGGDKVLESSSPGDGLLVADTSSSVFLRGATTSAGVGPPAAQDVDAPPGTVTSFAAPPRSLEITSPLREGEAGTLVIEGQPDELTAVFVSFTGGALFAPGKQGAFELGAPFFGPLLLTANPSPSGIWTIPVSIPSLNPPALMEQTFLLQLAVHDGSQVLLEGGSAFVLLDSSVP